MDLLNNPRVDAEKRIKQLNKRLNAICVYKSERLTINYTNGVASSIGINPYVKVNKASRIIKELHRQINATNKILKSF